MFRKISAFVAFNVYSFFLVCGFGLSTPDLFRENVGLNEMVWQNHYIWRLFSGVIVTALAGFLAGAIAQDKNGKITAIANIPSVLFWIGSFFLDIFGEDNTVVKAGYLIVYVVAIPLTTWFAYHAGMQGTMAQEKNFPEGTILGIQGWHWAWVWLPLSIYTPFIVVVLGEFSRLAFAWGDSWLTPILSPLVCIPMIAWGMPLAYTHAVLSGNSLKNKSSFIQTTAILGSLVGGFVVAFGIQTICFQLIHKIISGWLSFWNALF